MSSRPLLSLDSGREYTDEKGNLINGGRQKTNFFLFSSSQSFFLLLKLMRLRHTFICSANIKKTMDRTYHYEEERRNER